MSEIELKFLLDEMSSKALLMRLKALKMVAARRVAFRSVYLDTTEHVLKKAGITLRIRRDGRRWIQTVKTKGKIHGGLSQVGEVENPAPGGRVRLDAIPDPSIREAILRHVNDAPLLPVCETVIKRSTYEVSLEDGTRAELAIDAGVVGAGERSAELHEAEIELLEGDATGLFDIARKLFPEGGLQFSELSKLKLRYAVEFFAPLFRSKRLDHFLKRLKRLQTVFGSLNDAATVRNMFAAPEVPGVGHPAAQRAIGWILGASQARAEFNWSKARALWRDLQRDPPVLEMRRTG